jgi:hypothetical protein
MGAIVDSYYNFSHSAVEAQSVYVQLKDLVEIIEWKFILFIVSGNVICLRICFRKRQKCSPGA